jgi:hypothetical protein
MKTSRRDFVKLAGATGSAIIISVIHACSQDSREIKLITPVDGDMLAEIDGIIQEAGLGIAVKISAAPGSRIKVNNVPVKRIDGIYVAEILLTRYSNPIEISESKSGYNQKITVYWLKNYLNKYRLSLDDNILFLKDISENSSSYKSIFENPYMSFLREVHDTYGTKIHINIYYQTEGFNLTQMTDKFRDEWRNNADWLRLSFHALQNDPDKPYITAGYDELKRDCEMVKAQIRRFAGEELLGPVTTLHWGEARVEGCRALRDSGYKALAGYFEFEDGQPVVSYYLDADKTGHIRRRGIWCDNSEGIIFKKIHMVINLFKHEEIIPFLDKLKKDPHNSGFIDLMIHEQYFYPSYVAYQPDFREKVMTAVKWVTDNGYQPAFLSECLFD